jgi:arginase
LSNWHEILLSNNFVLATTFWFEVVISILMRSMLFQAPLCPLVLGGDHSISYPVVRAVSEKLGGPVDILHLDAHPDIYHCFEGNKYSHASSFARIMEGGYARRLLQVYFCNAL